MEEEGDGLTGVGGRGCGGEDGPETLGGPCGQEDIQGKGWLRNGLTRLGGMSQLLRGGVGGGVEKIPEVASSARTAGENSHSSLGR